MKKFLSILLVASMLTVCTEAVSAITHESLFIGLTASAKSAVGTYVVESWDGVNVRAGASTDYYIRGAAPQGTKFTVTSISGDFGYTESIYTCGYGYVSGYVYLPCCKLISSSSTDDDDNNVISNSDQRNAVVALALAQVGFREEYGKPNPYYGWAVNNPEAKDAWCAAFASWCLNNCGLSSSQYGGRKAQIGCPTWVSCLKNNNMFMAKDSGYIPKPGDLIFYDRYDSYDRYGYPNGTPDHVGIVTECDGSTIKTVEGNVTGNMVDTRSVSVNFWGIFGYGKVAYTENKPVLRGDLNNDNKYSITDVVKMRLFLESYSGETVDMSLYDCNEDGVLDNNDYEALSLYTSGIISSMKGYISETSTQKITVSTGLRDISRTDYVFDVYCGWAEDETPITLFPRHGGSNQVFELIESEVKGYYYIKSSYSDLYWNINFGCDPAKYNKLQLYSLSKGSPNMLFKLQKKGIGYYITTYYGAILAFNSNGEIFATTDEINSFFYKTFYIDYLD